MSEARQGGRKLRMAVQWVLIVATIVALGWLLWDRREDLAQLQRVDAGTLALVGLAIAANSYLGGWSIKLQAGRFGARISHFEAMMLGIATVTLNYLPMKSGTILQGAVMKTRYGVRLSEYAALITGNHLMSLWAAATMGGTFMVLIGVGGIMGWLLFLAPTATLVVLYFWGNARGVRELDELVKDGPRWKRSAAIAVEGMWMLFRDLPLVASLMAINIAAIMLQAFRLWIIMNALGVFTSLTQSIVAASIALVTYRFAFVPGGLGFREAGVAAGMALVGLDPTAGLAAAVIDRAMDVGWVLLVGLPSSIYLSRIPAVAEAEAEDPYTDEAMP